jgi:hypothetical protein
VEGVSQTIEAGRRAMREMLCGVESRHVCRTGPERQARRANSTAPVGIRPKPRHPMDVVDVEYRSRSSARPEHFT